MNVVSINYHANNLGKRLHLTTLRQRASAQQKRTGVGPFLRR